MTLGSSQPAPDSRTTEAMPAGISAVFACGAPPSLLALTVQGDLLFRRISGEWCPLERLAPCSLPGFSFAVATCELGFATVLGGRAVIGRINSDCPEPSIQSRVFEEAVICGAPALIENDRMAFPVRSGSSVKIAFYDFRSESWSEMAVAGYFADSEGYFAVPVQNRSAVPDTFWVGRRNYLVLGSDFGERSGELRDFGPEVHAVLGPLPYRDKSDILHVLIETESSFAFQSLTSNPRTKPLDGPHLAAGNQSYFSRLAYPSVLDDEPVALQIEAGVDRILLPLAFSETTGSRNEGTLLVYVEGVTSSPDIFSDDTSRVFRGSLYWHSGVRLFNLQATLQFRSRYDIIVYQIGKALFAGSATTGVLHRWDCI